ncbi:YrbL family protein [Lutibaculum baratangense]|uniref:PhoP regulatory network protein YrbL n=1 Tax=Lutibaculum baratangense AMV1 TaxID=631454 RepID=V4RHT0_9HYPH|nr:YrbL family protein [Lutibaculum baratangense]ESR22825.1 hypothetical protein N177_3962 [Lutibaculum baratangense AMV1]
MLRLRSADLISSGAFRSCYRHPEDPKLCVKIARPRAAAGRAGHLDRLFRRRMAGANERECREYGRLSSAGVPLSRYFPAVHGFVETDLGRGLCLDLVEGSDGQGPLSLTDIMAGRIWPDLDAEFVLDEVRQFGRFCERYGILASCDEPSNIGFVREGAGFRLVAYDLKLRPNKELIPISTLFLAQRRRKIARRFDRLFAPLAAALRWPTAT